MKKKIWIITAIMAMSMSVFTCCTKTKEKEDKQVEQSQTEEAKKLANMEDTIVVLCDSKVNNDVDAFLTLFESMKGLMRSVVTENDYFAGISANYKEECGDNIQWNYELTEKVEADEEKRKSYEESLETFGNKAAISQAYDIKAKVKLEGSKGKKEYDLEMSVGKIGEKWQIVNFGETLLQ